MKNRIAFVVLLLAIGLSLFFAGVLKTLSPPDSPAEDYQGDHKKVDRKTLAKLGERSAPLIRQAAQLIKEKKFTKAIELLEEIIAHVPVDPGSYILLSTLYANLRKENEALKVLERGTDVDTDHDLIFSKFLKNIPQINSEPDTIPSEGVWITTFKDNKKAAVSYIFDDGPKSVYTHGFPVFDRFGFKATVTMVPGGIEGNALAGTWDQWRDAHKRGFEIGNHSMNHPILRGLTEEALDNEINGSFEIIVKEIGEPPFTFVFPFERFDFDSNAVRKVMERHRAIADHNYLETVYPKVFHPIFGGKRFSAQTAIELTKLAAQKKLWLIAQCHGIGLLHKKTFRPVTPEFLEEHLSFIKENENEIWIDTFRNVYCYLFEKKNTAITVKETSSRGVIFQVKNDLDPRIFSVPLTVGINPAAGNLVKASARQDGRPLDVKIQENYLFVNIQPVNSTVQIEF